ncbi:acetylcholinesterase [Dactylonectria macrodidyma]|uniref:Acetylcholinesterase n=1 Tax=Dactylonectria macrodidyma TaxID=307937 RepID=A0A9P9JDA2_9HYPO|nr:acetylcholinesterase [Dactylonectria macrodidyma]
MKLAAASLFALVANAVLSQAASGTNYSSLDSNLTVRTSTGTFTGIIDADFPNTRQWRAIPFAGPPAGSRRWLPPQKFSSSPSKHHYANKLRPSCPQFVTAVESVWNLPITKSETTSEDCLYLAVWTPTAPPPKKWVPVLFFMTGGGFIIGGIDLPWQIPTPWVDRPQSVIIVTINYRINIFGFPNARRLANGDQNLGILDQRAALEWVRGNIAAFGGDPGRIMQWGRSAGVVSADLHAYAYHVDPTAQSYYLESGTALTMNPADDSKHFNFSFVAQHVGCAEPCGVGCEDRDGAAELDCMRRISKPVGH